MVPYGGAKSFLPSAELLMPTTAWGKNYVAVLPRATTGPPWAQIVGSVDGTTVSIVPTAPLPSGTGVAAAPANVVTTFALNAGEFIQWQASGVSGDMTGSVISADQPIAFVGGTAYLCLHSQTSTGGGCDSAHQMVPPISALASEYVVPPYATRLASMDPESIPYRFVGVQNGTALTYDPPVAGAPATLDLGQVAEFETTVAFSVKSQDTTHPFYVGQHMTGSILVGASRPATTDGNICSGLPRRRGVREHRAARAMAVEVRLLHRPDVPDDEHSCSSASVRRRASSPSASIAWARSAAGNPSTWRATSEITNVDLVRGQPNGTCTNGGHVASSTASFGLMVWGLDARARRTRTRRAASVSSKINDVVVPPLPK